MSDFMSKTFEMSKNSALQMMNLDQNLHKCLGLFKGSVCFLPRGHFFYSKIICDAWIYVYMYVSGPIFER